MNPDLVRSITASELHSMMEKKTDFQLIDIREADELEICCLGGQHIPLGEIEKRKNEISREKTVILHCKSGKRAEMAVLFLQQNHGFTNLYNLSNGILGFSEINPDVTIY
jgi:rhodanese-related sulfurtransferase